AICRSFVDVDGGLEDATIGLVRSGERYEHAAVEGVSNTYMSMLARRLAPVVDASIVIDDDSDIPHSVPFLSLVGSEVADEPEVIIERWRQNYTIIDRNDTPRPRLKRAGDLRAIV